MKKKVKFSCKTTATAVAFVLMLCMAASLVLLPARGQILWQGRTTAYPYIGAVPNPALVGEEVLLHIGITQELQQQPDGWEGLSVTIERPDGKTDTLEDIRTDSTGGTGRVYVPDIEGTYYLQTHFPAQWYNFSTFDFATFQMINVNYYYEDAVSEILELVVTAGEPTYWPGTPLPTEYWTRPIDSQLREWAPVAGSWLYNPGIFGTTVAPGNDDAPETAHVLWSKQLVLGGLAGGTLGDWATYTGDAYEGKFQGSLIIQGVFLYQKFDSVGTETTADVPVDNWVVAVDLHTGETLWEKELLDTDGNRLIPAFGQIYYWNSFNTHGTHAYLWAWEDPGFFGFAPTTWHAFDPLTGRWIYTMNNIPSGNRMYGPQGEILIYTINLAGGYMTCWNSSAVLDAYWGTSYPMWGSWRPQGKIIDATGPCPATSGTPYGLNGYQSNISIPTGLPGSVSRQFFDDVIFGYYRGDTVGMFSTISYDNPPFTIWAFDAQTGNLKFSRTHAAPSGNVSLTVATVSDEERVVVIWSKERRQLWGYSLENGNLLWGPTEPQHYLDIYAMYPTIEYGKLYSNGMSGIMYCYDAQTGDLLWNYTYRDMYGEVLWANDWSSLRPRIITDGKIYMGQSEHSPVNPLPRGAPFVCLNATTGEEIWAVEGMFRQTDWGGSAIIGDSIIATMDTYDQRIYAIGKGPSATMVSIQNDVITYGDSVLVKGMVTDVSPGTNDAALTMRFPNGVPAVSDADMSDWMLYVYKQFERSADVVGVDVVVSVLDPNMNSYEVARTTSDASGYFGCTFVPEVPGFYKVIATFEGSAGYYGSFAETFVHVEEAPAATPMPTPEPESVADLYFVPMSIGMIIAIIVVGLLVFLLLRRR